MAILKVHDNLSQWCVDENKTAAQVLLDLSAAFDNSDHQILPREIILQNNSDFHLHANDSQMCQTFTPTIASETTTSVEHLTQNIK